MAVPIFRYLITWRESAEITSIGKFSDSLTAAPVFPDPVGPQIMGIEIIILPPPKLLIEIIFADFYKSRTAMGTGIFIPAVQQGGNQMNRFLIG